jgi:hypothetical protein
MMRQTIRSLFRLNCTIILMLVLVFVCSYHQTAQAENADSNGAVAESAPSVANRNEKELMETEDKWLEAGIRGDAGTAALLLAEDYQGMTPTGSVEDKSQFVASVRAGALRADSYHQDERYVRILGETAVSTGRLSLKQQDGFTQTRYTRVYVRRQGHWQLFVMQTTRIVRQ